MRWGMVPPTGPTGMTWHHAGTCWSHVVDVASWSHKVGLQLGVAWSYQWAPHLMWPCRAESAARSSPSDFYFITIMRWGMVPPTGPTGMTWHHAGTCWSHVVDVASWSHKVGLQLGVAWSYQWAPHLMWPCKAESAARSSPSDFYFIWQKNLLYGSLDPTTCCCGHK